MLRRPPTAPGDPQRERGIPRRNALTARVGEVRSAAQERWLAAQPRLEPVSRVVRCVSPLGWMVLGASVGSWLLAALFGWTEFAFVAAALLALFLLACMFTIGRTRIDVGLRVHPTRVTAGDVAVAEVRVRNTGSGRLLPVPLELPCGDTSARFLVPGLRPGAEHDDVVMLPSQRRGIYPIGPITTLRGDPLGLIRRVLSWTGTVDFIVHPPTVFVDAFGTGVLRDLEGRTTNDTSLSDLAFQALREYVPGDDQRHIHWGATATRSSLSGSTSLMVRQFLDTRRTHAGIILDASRGAYADDGEFEVAVQVAASLAQRAVRDKVDLSQASGSLVLTYAKGHAAMDLYARVELGDQRIDLVAARLARCSPNMSTVIIVTGSRAAMDAVTQAAGVFSTRVNVVMMQVVPGAELARQRSVGRVLVTLGDLADLPRALAAGAPQ